MAQPTSEATQRVAARIAGWTLLVLMVSGFTGMFAFGSAGVIDGDAAATAHNILMHERAFRGSLICEVVMLNCDILLALALYVLLKPVNSTLALLGSFWRFANAVLLGVGVASSLVALDLFTGPNYMSLLSAGQSHGLALLFFDLHDRLSLFGLLFFCCGAGVHSWLLYKSRYIPRFLSGLYLFASIEMLFCCFAFILFPHSRKFLDPAFLIPDVPAELFTALWLAIKGVKLSASTAELTAAT